MRNYEVTFIVDPVLSSDEIKATAQIYVDMLLSEGCQIVHKDEMGLRQLAYPIKKRSSGIYFCIEFQSVDGIVIDKLELALRRDERIMRFLCAALDKFGIKYNDDKRSGKIGTVKKKAKPIAVIDTRASSAPVITAPAAPVAAAPVVAEETPAAVEAPVEAKAEPVVEAKVEAPVEAPVEETVEAPVEETAETVEAEATPEPVEAEVVAETPEQKEEE